MSGNTSSAAYCRRIPLTVNSGKLSPVYPDNIDEPVVRKEDLPTLFLGETALFCLTFLDADGNALAFAADDVFELNVDSDYSHGDDPLMAAAAGPDAVNVSGDWSEADFAAGKLSIRVNCGTVGFAQKIAGAESCAIRIEVRRSAAGNTAYSVLMSADGTARNTIRYDENTPDSADPEYYTAAQTDTLFAGKADASHTHTASEVSDLSLVLAGKADAVHGHAQSDVTGLADELAAKSPMEHTHNIDGVAGLESALAGKANSIHQHAASDTPELTGLLAGKADSSHTHAQADVTGLTAALSGKANASHTHTQAQISGLTATLAGKANSTHTHAASEVTGLATVAVSGSYNDLADQPSIPAAPVAYVTNTWRASDGLSWYRLYSDNWIEQGGSVASSSGLQTITLPHSMSSENYTALKNYNSSDSGTAVSRVLGIYNKTATTFQTYGGAFSFDWYVCGFIA